MVPVVSSSVQYIGFHPFILSSVPYVLARLRYKNSHVYILLGDKGATLLLFSLNSEEGEKYVPFLREFQFTGLYLFNYSLQPEVFLPFR